MILGDFSSFEFDCGLSVLDIFDPTVTFPSGGVVVVVVVVMFSPVNINLVVSKSTVIGLIMSSFTKSKLGIASDFRLFLSMFSTNPISSISKVVTELRTDFSATLISYYLLSLSASEASL